MADIAAARPIEDRTAPVARGAVNLLFIAPAMLLFGGFVLLPVASALYYAFTHWDGFTPPRWAGLANFQRALADSVHLMSYVHVVLYILGTLVFEVAFGLLVAVLLNSDRRGFALLRGLFFSPVVLSMTAAGVLWAFVLDYRSGLLNSVLRALGAGDLAQPWLSQPGTALVAIIIVSGWKYSGFYMVIFFAALRRIPRNIFEAATLDGAGPVRGFFSITLPLLRQNVLVAVLLAITGGFAGFDLFFTMTNGGPFSATEVPATWIMKQAFDQNQLSYGIALTVVLAVVVMLISLIYLRLSERLSVTRY
ncbi:MAG: sugar transporter permease [Devosia sp.]|uniref:carbohydrate ABC transporter permease n=1 Tax=Devosia sp. TaxID=1871048 RepID=UPI00262E65BE|nr:sugar ABC transporter permease [Devosia sp.]MDB5541180.1 sugar transporter permease [Devosia sp.]